MKNYYSENTRFYVVVDCIVFGFDNGKLKLLIRKRAIEPGMGEWTLCGAFVRENEDLQDSANRAITSMTGIKQVFSQQVKTYGNVKADASERVISVAYYSLINVKDYDVELMDKYGLRWVEITDVPHLWGNLNQVVDDALDLLRKRIKIEPIGFNLLPELFTLTQLQHVYEAVLGGEIDKRNFRKRIKNLDFIEKTDKIDKLSSKRGAALFRFNEKAYSEHGTIKANFPGRMAFRVSAMIDSRTILDRPGADQLVGRGDMLIINGSEPVRVQCAFIDTPEVEAINEYICNQPGPTSPYELPEPAADNAGNIGGGSMDMGSLDPLFMDAARSVVSTQQGSTSMIQRRFSIGYNRAGRLMDQLEKAGIVGEAHGGKPREVLIQDESSLMALLENVK